MKPTIKMIIVAGLLVGVAAELVHTTPPSYEDAHVSHDHRVEWVGGPTGSFYLGS